MNIIDIQGNYPTLGISSRLITEGEEINMVRSFINYRKNFFKPKDDKGLAVFLETKINNSYPDIVFAEYNPKLYYEWNDNRNRLDMNDLKILHYIYSNNGVSSHKIVREMAIQYRTLLHSIEKLLDAKLINRFNEEWQVVDRDNIFGVKKIEAVEAKISKWDQVLQQAIINKSFASESCILSKRKHQIDDAILEKTKSFGIGVYLYDNEKFSRVSSSGKNKFPNNYNSIYINECIGRIINS